MNAFCVWTRPLANACKVRVLGIRNAKWLLNRLSRSFLVKSSETVNEKECFPCCTFRVPYNFQMCHRTFERLLTAIPEVRLMTEPA
jgi:hypothetical protein